MYNNQAELQVKQFIRAMRTYTDVNYEEAVTEECLATESSNYRKHRSDVLWKKTMDEFRDAHLNDQV